jgi:hypothetical protein
MKFICKEKWIELVKFAAEFNLTEEELSVLLDQYSTNGKILNVRNYNKRTN